MKLSIILSIIMTVAWIISVLATAHAEDFKYNMTQKQTQEANLIYICMNMNQTKILIPSLVHTCWEIYGGPIV